MKYCPRVERTGGQSCGGGRLVFRLRQEYSQFAQLCIILYPRFRRIFMQIIFTPSFALCLKRRQRRILLVLVCFLFSLRILML